MPNLLDDLWKSAGIPLAGEVVGGLLGLGRGARRAQKELAWAQRDALKQQMEVLRQQNDLARRAFGLNEQAFNYGFGRAQKLDTRNDNLFDRIYAGLWNGSSPQAQTAAYAAFAAPVRQQYQQAEDRLRNEFGDGMGSPSAFAGQIAALRAGEAGQRGGFLGQQAQEATPQARAQRIAALLTGPAAVPSMPGWGMNAGGYGDAAQGFGQASAAYGQQVPQIGAWLSEYLQQLELRKLLQQLAGGGTPNGGGLLGDGRQQGDYLPSTTA